MYQYSHYRSHGRRREKGSEKIFEEIIAENFPNMGKEIVNQVQEVQRVPGRINPRTLVDLSNYQSLLLEFIRKNGKSILTPIIQIRGYYTLTIFYVLVTILNKCDFTQSV